MDRDTESLWTPLHWLTILRAHGSYTAAAQRLGVSKAAMSQRIADLERAAGVQLVRRTTRSVQLTEAGLRLVDETAGAFEQISSSFSGVRDAADTLTGKLRVTAPVAFARQQLVHRLPEFMKLHPGLQIELEMSDELRSLARDGFDVAVRHTSAPPETHVAWTLATTQSVLVASPAYLHLKGAPQSPNELVQHECLFYPRGHSIPSWSLQRKSSRNRRRTAEVEVVRVTGHFAANNSEALRDAAIAGLGIALVPDFSAQSGLEANTLVRVLPEWEPIGNFGRFLYAVRPYSAQVPRPVSLFVDFLKSKFACGFAPLE